MLNSEQILKSIEENHTTIYQYGVKSIGIFGSYACNAATDESDIDILIEFEKGKKTFDNYMDLKFYLQELFKKDVDLVIKESVKEELKQYIYKSVKYAAGL